MRPVVKSSQQAEELKALARPREGLGDKAMAWPGN